MALRVSRKEPESLEAIALLSADRQSKASLARLLSTNRLRVGEWIRRFEQKRLEGLIDEPRSGRLTRITALERHQMIATT